jgi:DNA (cytosine-5)-methyltransferase 1
MSKDNLLQIRLDESIKKLLEQVCHNEKMTLSEKVRELIQEYAKTQLRDESMTKKTVKKTIPKWIASDSKKVFSVGEMYSGPGGIGVALSNTVLKSKSYDLSFEHSWATDYDADTCKTYKNNLLKDIPDAISICADIKDVALNELPMTDGFLYGFPCNDFSLVGESKGLKGKFGALYKYGVEYIDYANPLFIFAENVSGLSSANSGSAFTKILSELNNAGKFGYDLTVHKYKFEDYEVPQARHRYIVIGTRGDLGLKFQVPKPSLKMRTCKEAITKPPIKADADNNELTKQSKTVIERLEHTLPGENAWTATLPPHLQLNVKGAKISQIYKRLDPNKPSYTVTGSGGGGTHVYHWSDPRALTNRERARLQTFPDDFVFHGSKESVRSQIGMAVPVDGAKIILEALLKTFAHIKYPSVEPTDGFYKAKSL